MTNRAFYENLDAIDPLNSLRNEFYLPPDTIYLDGNSLGVMPLAAHIRIKNAVLQEWADDLIASWNKADWINLPMRVGNKIAPLIGAGQDETVVCDSTSVNLYKVLYSAIQIARKRHPKRRKIVSEKTNFPTDLYIAQSLCAQFDMTLELVESEAIESAIDDELAVLLLTHVNYRSGAIHDMAQITSLAQARDALVIWDLCHSAGSIPVDLTAAQADFAVGCTYKFLNGGPGSPAFVWVHPHHVDAITQPLTGWMGHATPFTFDTQYQPATGIRSYLGGTPPVLALSALDGSLEVFQKAESFGGMQAIYKKAQTLTSLFIQLAEKECADYGLTLVSPRDPERRASQVSLSHPEGAYAIIQALIARGVVGDYREPGILRFGFTPLYVRYIDVWDTVMHLKSVLQDQTWRSDAFSARRTVT
ncbi:kynureninase [Advenella mimigardefordensis]|uniref:Kynureninase n=1 Tax=Advenella mimigardefordensis (strain DSM 17166 / LMG 22922 / DPN7) TaxID=1247726 RepID=W0PCF2_ADVMD|nr:kynureninase [Advenella mimigardefordensis]AHG64416.1 kynureninase [Advenella mimigardefordensis DPN7]